LLHLVGLNWTVRDFSTLSRRQKTLAVRMPNRGFKKSLHLLIDSMGTKAEGEGECHTSGSAASPSTVPATLAHTTMP